MPSFARAITTSARFVLDVLGGCGAVWGVSELLGVRRGPNNDLWRVISCVVFLLFLVRWAVVDLAGPGRRRPNASTARRVLDHAHSFHLQVVGGAGALWGGLEVAGFRVNYPTNCHDKTAFPAGVGAAWAPGFKECAGTYPVCRVVCGVGFVWFHVRWIAIRVCLARRRPGGAERGSGRRERGESEGEGEGAGCVGEGGNADAASAGETPCSSRRKGCARGEGGRRHRNGRGCCSLSRLSAAATPLLELLSTFVLDCVGAAGAVWGVAEVAGHSGASLRLGWGDRMFGQPSFDLWRLICSMVFVLFTARWVVVAGLCATTGGGGGGGGTARVSTKLAANGVCNGKGKGGASGRLAEARADSTIPLASAWLHLPGEARGIAGPFCNSTNVPGSSRDVVSGEAGDAGDAGDASDVVVELVVQCAPATTASEVVLSLGGDVSPASPPPSRCGT